MKFLVVFGTRPEAIKLSSLINALRLKGPPSLVRICATSQHKTMLDPILSALKIYPDDFLNVMHPKQDLTDLTSKALSRLKPILKEYRPDWVLVQGDTSSALAGALAASYEKIPVAHIEAGLRTGDIHSPWPEEFHRRLIGQIAQINFAPTPNAAHNLIKEGVDRRRVLVTGNTGIDALTSALSRLDHDARLKQTLNTHWNFLNPEKKLILATIHRRENFGAAMKQVFSALRTLSQRKDVQIIFPAHLNPQVQTPAKKTLGNLPNIRVTPPLDYYSFVYLMCKSHMIITDSGGIQEEAPLLGKPILVTRESTERPEGVAQKTALLVGTKTQTIIAQANKLLDNSAAYRKMSRVHSPYGDGHAADRIARALLN